MMTLSPDAATVLAGKEQNKGEAVDYVAFITAGENMQKGENNDINSSGKVLKRILPGDKAVKFSTKGRTT